MHSSTWWEDIGDSDSTALGRYWDGWQELVARIQSHIDSNRAMTEARDRLRGERV
jgi:hypothetical protein